MQYRDLIKFEPVEDIIQLRDGNRKENARTHVETYVISKHMKTKFLMEICPNLEFNTPNQKGILIIGNYGTGKSHLMSFIGAIAEYSDFYEYVKEDQLKKRLKNIAGRYKVLRIEIGNTKKSLRNIIIDELEKFMLSIDIVFKFPNQDEITNHKDSFEKLINLISEKYDGKGLLLIIDEILDYLKGRSEYEIINDFIFFRELGEICSKTKFKFLAGLQEKLFNNPRFSFVSKSLNRSKDRFREIIISKEDIEYVVANRILNKNNEQKKTISKYLQHYQKLYPNLNRDFKKFVDLFPVHPNFIVVFQSIEIVEKREILKTLSELINEILEKKIEEESLHLITIDSYFERLENLISNEDVNSTLNVAKRLITLIQNNMEKNYYIKNSIRIIKALAVYRLSVITLDSEVGLTVGRIRDNLLIYEPKLPIQDHTFLETHVKSLLEEIKSTVTGQFMGFNSENQQYFLDLKKTVDFEQKILDFIPTIPEQYNKYFYKILKILMEQTDRTYIPNHEIWEYELIWQKHNVGRRGYLFFGTPSEKSTAEPARDFYIFFINLFGKQNFKDYQDSEDEVYFFFKNIPNDIIDTIKHYSAANQLSKGTDKDTARNYDKISKKDENKLIVWFRSNVFNILKIIYLSEEYDLKKFLKLTRKNNFKNIIDDITPKIFDNHLNGKYPEYPYFSKIITYNNQHKLCDDLMKGILGAHITDYGISILNGLGINKSHQNYEYDNSKYAQWVLDSLKSKNGKVLKREDLFHNDFSKKFSLESELMTIIIMILVYSGNIEISVKGKMYNINNINSLKNKFSSLIEFDHIQKPSKIDWSVINRLLKVLSINDIAANPKNSKLLVRELKSSLRLLSEKNARSLSYLKIQDFRIFSVLIVNKKVKTQYVDRLERNQILTDSLLSLDSIRKFSTFQMKDEDYAILRRTILSIKELEDFQGSFNKVSHLYSYMINSYSIFEDDSEVSQKFSNKLEKFKDEFIELRNFIQITDKSNEFILELDEIKNKFILDYMKLHRIARLTKEGDVRKQDLMGSVTMKHLLKLSKMAIFPEKDIKNILEKFNQLMPCYDLEKEDLAKTLMCNRCKFIPKLNSIMLNSEEIMNEIEIEINNIESLWRESLHRELSENSIKNNILLLEKNRQILVSNFLETETFPENETDFEELLISINLCFQNLEKVRIDTDELLDSLSIGGFPCTVEEFQNRFMIFIKTIVDNKENPRLTMD